METSLENLYVDTGAKRVHVDQGHRWVETATAMKRSSKISTAT